MKEEYHIPVLLSESIEGLITDKDGVYLDVTFGAGGHSKLIVDSLNDNGRLYAFDQDVEAEANVFDDDKLIFTRANFQHIEKYLRVYGIKEVDGVFADLGVSSHQFDDADRGFSYRYEGELDMRMNRSAEKKAKDVLNEYREEDLWKILGEYGEVRNAKTLARKIVARRKVIPFHGMTDFVEFLNENRMGERMRYLSQVFQAIRIEVNDEMLVLNEFLEASLRLLKKGGRLVVLSYHSGEDRLVKRFMKTGNIAGVYEKDDYGNIYRPFKVINKKPIEASVEEVKRNVRARSAKLRIAEKI